MLNTYQREEIIEGIKVWKTYVTINELQTDPNNPREISTTKQIDLDYYIDKYELLAPLLVDIRPETSGRLLGGNMRFSRYQAKGKTEVWIEPRLPKDDAEAFEIATISNMQFASYVEKLMANLATQFKERIDLTRLSVPLAPETNLQSILNRMGKKVSEDTPPGVDTANPAKSVLGTVYQLGPHKVLCGDATDPAAYLALLQGAKVDLLFTDPPYNVSYTGKTKEALTIQNDTQKTDDFYGFLFLAFKNMAEAAKAGASIYVCHVDIERVNFTKAFQEAGWKLAQVIIWSKSHFVMGRQDYHWQHEPILYGWKEGAEHFYNGGRAQTTLWNIDRPTASEEHPTIKPIQLIARALSNSSKGDDIVLDPFLGSGSTLIACQQMGRICFGIELDPKYVDVIRKRYAKFIGQGADWETATPALGQLYGAQSQAPLEGLDPLPTV
jgi:DNA modification methylase